MNLSFCDKAHEDFYYNGLQKAQEVGGQVDSYFRAFLYLCGLCHDTRVHFDRLFIWREWCIQPEALADGWQTGTTGKIVRLAFNLWNGYGYDVQDGEQISMLFLPDELFCCEFQPYFFEAIRLRFPEYAHFIEK